MKQKKTKKEFLAWAKPILKQAQEKLLLNDRRLMKVKITNGSKSTCAFRYPYKDIYIDIGMDFFDSWANGDADDKEQVRSMLIHEMVHVLTDPLYSKSLERFLSRSEIECEREALTDHITNILIKNNVL